MMSISKAWIHMIHFLTMKELWENTDEKERQKKEIGKEIREGDVTLFYLLYSHNCGGRKSMLSLQDSKITMA